MATEAGMVEESVLIIDGWVVSKKPPYVFPNSGREISRDCSKGEFCVELTKEIITMMSKGMGFDTCIDCAHELAGEWGGFIGSEKALAYTLISGRPVFIIEDLSDLPTHALKAIYRYWLRHNECRAGKKEQLLRYWNEAGRIEYPSMMELLDRIEAEGRWEVIEPEIEEEFLFGLIIPSEDEEIIYGPGEEDE